MSWGTACQPKLHKIKVSHKITAFVASFLQIKEKVLQYTLDY